MKAVGETVPAPDSPLSDPAKSAEKSLRATLPAERPVTEAQIDQLLVELTANAIWREPKPGSPAPERGDDHLWARLSAYSGSILVTGDRLLLENAPTRSSVISPSTSLSDFASDGGRER
jgi:hypothetical protein